LRYPPQPNSTLFPYTTLFRSEVVRARNNGELAAYILQLSGDSAKNVRRLNLIAILARAGVEMTLLNTNGSEVNAESLLSLPVPRSEEHTSELQSRFDLVCRLL